MATADTKRSVRERLLQAADALFYSEGVHTVGIDRVLAQAGVAKASLYSTFGSKDELVREYLRGRDERARERITKRLETIEEPRARILAVFDGLRARVAQGQYYGCPFVRASAEGPPGPNAAREASANHRSWLRALFERLAGESGLATPAAVSQQLSFLYDGAATAVAMEGNHEAPRLARKAAECLIDAGLSGKKTSPARKTRAPRPTR